MFCTVILGLTLGADPVVILHRDDGKSKQPLVATRRAPLAIETGFGVGAASASYKKCFDAAGKRPIRFIVAADRDGDGNDELVVARETIADHSLDVAIVSAPSELGEKKPSIVASTPSGVLGFATGDGRVTALGRIDCDGDDVDELAIVRSFADGHQDVEIRDLPQGKKQPLGEPVFTFANAGSSGAEIVALFGVPLTDGPEWLVALRRSGSGIDVEAHGYFDQITTLDSPLLFTPAIASADELRAAHPVRLPDGLEGIFLVVQAAGAAHARTFAIDLEKGATPATFEFDDPLPSLPLFAAVPLRVDPGVDDTDGDPEDPPPGTDPPTMFELRVGNGSKVLGTFLVPAVLNGGTFEFTTITESKLEFQVVNGPTPHSLALKPLTPNSILSIKTFANGSLANATITLDLVLESAASAGLGGLFSVKVSCLPTSKMSTSLAAGTNATIGWMTLASPD